MSDQGKVTTRTNEGICEIHFSHPRGNSLPGKILQSLADEIQKVGLDLAARVIVLRSEGDKVFCGGASFDELTSVKDSSAGHEFFMGFAKVILAIRQCPKFVVARVQGKAVGGGVGLIAACDYALALDTAAVRLSEFALGFGPFVISPAVIRKLGIAAFSALTIDTEWRDAAWCKAHSLYAEIFSSAGALDEALQALLTKLAHSNPAATKKIKEVLWHGTDDWSKMLSDRAGMSAELLCSDFVRNSLEAIQQKSRGEKPSPK